MHYYFNPMPEDTELCNDFDNGLKSIFVLIIISSIIYILKSYNSYEFLINNYENLDIKYINLFSIELYINFFLTLISIPLIIWYVMKRSLVPYIIMFIVFVKFSFNIFELLIYRLENLNLNQENALISIFSMIFQIFLFIYFLLSPNVKWTFTRFNSQKHLKVNH